MEMRSDWSLSCTESVLPGMRDFCVKNGRWVLLQ
ncbi:hypothetical protein P3T22_006190 [Paraburkholderia sp. GAS348]